MIPSHRLIRSNRFLESLVVKKKVSGGLCLQILQHRRTASKSNGHCQILPTQQKTTIRAGPAKLQNVNLHKESIERERRTD